MPLSLPYLCRNNVPSVKIVFSPGKSPRGNVEANVCPDGMLGIFTPLNVAEGNAIDNLSQRRLFSSKEYCIDGFLLPICRMFGNRGRDMGLRLNRPRCSSLKLDISSLKVSYLSINSVTRSSKLRPNLSSNPCIFPKGPPLNDIPSAIDISTIPLVSLEKSVPIKSSPFAIRSLKEQCIVH